MFLLHVSTAYPTPLLYCLDQVPLTRNISDDGCSGGTLQQVYTIGGVVPTVPDLNTAQFESFQDSISSFQCYFFD